MIVGQVIYFQADIHIGLLIGDWEQSWHSVHDVDSLRAKHLHITQRSCSSVATGMGAESRSSTAFLAMVPEGQSLLLQTLRVAILIRPHQIAVIGTPVPINSIIFSLVILIVIALINIGSTAALNTIFALLTGATSFSYALSITCILIKRLKGETLPPARFSMGKFAVPINVFAVAYVVTAAVASFFPVSLPVHAEDMNYACVMFGGVFIIAVVDYLVRGRKHYVEPLRHLNKI